MTENTSPILGHRFQKGESGNPAGKPRGARHKTTLMAERLMQDDVEKIVSAVLTAARNGDSAERRQSFEAAVGRIPVRRSAAGCRELSLPALLGIHGARLGCLLRRSCGGFGTDRARFRAGHSITLVQRDFTGDAALDWGYAGLRFSDRGARRFRVSGKYQGETHNKTQDQTHSDHFVSLKCLAAD